MVSIAAARWRASADAVAEYPQVDAIPDYVWTPLAPRADVCKVTVMLKRRATVMISKGQGEVPGPHSARRPRAPG